jgi:hypothetical protein
VTRQLILMGWLWPLLSAPVSAQVLEAVFPDGFEPVQTVRVDQLALRDPHLFVSLIGCNDVTDVLNSQLLSDLNGDADSDGVLDYSPLLQFRPLDTRTTAGIGHALDGDCSAPGAASCGAATAPVPFEYRGQEIGTCLSPIPGTTHSAYSPAITTPAGPCFAAQSDSAGAGLPLPVPLLDARIGAGRRDNPSTGLRDGLLYGFLTEAAADAITIELPVVGPRALSSLLPGGTGACAAHNDKDTHQGQSGWWMYFNFAASTVPFDN